MQRIYTFLALLALATSAPAQTSSARAKSATSPRKDVLTPPPPPKAATAQRAINPITIKVGEDDWRFADPAAFAIGSINLEAMATSPLVQGIVEQVAQDIPGGVEAFRTAFDKAIGRSGVRRISLSVKEGVSEPSVLILVTGRVNESDLAKLTQGKLEVRRLGLENVLLGSRTDLQAALRRLSVPRSNVNGALQQEGKLLAAANDIWFAGSLTGLSPLGAFKSPVKKLSFGLNLRQDIALNLTVDTGDLKTALDLAQKAQESQTELPEGASFSTTVDGSVVRMSLGMEGDRFKTFVAEAWKGQVKSGLASELGKMLEHANLSADGGQSGRTPAPKGKAVIYGLEDGPKEVPLRKP